MVTIDPTKIVSDRVSRHRSCTGRLVKRQGFSLTALSGDSTGPLSPDPGKECLEIIRVHPFLPGMHAGRNHPCTDFSFTENAAWCTLSLVAEPVKVAKPHGLVRYSQGVRKNSSRPGNPGIRTGPCSIISGICSFVNVIDCFFAFSCSIVSHRGFNSFFYRGKPHYSGREYISHPVLQNLKQQMKGGMIPHMMAWTRFPGPLLRFPQEECPFPVFSTIIRFDCVKPAFEKESAGYRVNAWDRHFRGFIFL